MSDRETTEAGCYCRAITLQLEGRPPSVVHCHCEQCRRLSGAAITTWASFLQGGLLDGAPALTATAHYFVDHNCAIGSVPGVRRPDAATPLRALQRLAPPGFT